jgi:hypothetical protein
LAYYFAATADPKTDTAGSQLWSAEEAGSEGSTVHELRKMAVYRHKIVVAAGFGETMIDGQLATNSIT